MQQLILVFHALVALALIGLVLIQHGKGADVGASFGSGASQTVFGSQGSTSFLVKLTSVLAAIFFVTSLTLGYMASHAAKQRKASLLESPAVQSVPVANKQVVNKATTPAVDTDLPAPVAPKKQSK
jgi:preprotein translocase subunit SecG